MKKPAFLPVLVALCLGAVPLRAVVVVDRVSDFTTAVPITTLTPPHWIVPGARSSTC